MIRLIYLILILVGLSNISLFAVTRYVAKPSANVTGAWASHWTTIAEVNAGTNPGDTVFFGTGIWRGTRLDVTGGSANAPTVYACSSFAFINGNGEYHFAKIYASTEIAGWTSLGGGVYSHSSASTGPIFEGQMMLLKNSSPILAQGEWWTDGSSETRIRLIGDKNPSVTSIEETVAGAKSTTIRVDAQDYVTLWGLDVRYGNNRNIEASFQSSSTHYINIEHCKVGPCAGDFSSNPGNIYSGTTTGLHNNWTIRACSVGASYALSGNAIKGTHGAALEFYSQNFLTVESCYVYGFHSHAAIYHKNDNGLSTYGNIYRYNEIQTDNDNIMLMRIYRGKRNVEIYGNTFLPHAGSGIIDGPSNTGDGNHSIYNNTFINVDVPFSTCWYEGSTRKIDVRFKYNVIYHSGTAEINVSTADLGNPSDPTIIDNNIYFSTGNKFSSGGCAGQSYNNLGLSGWQNLGWDINSTVLPASSNDFANLAGGNYDRTNASGEMDTTYGGQRWTKYGAVQTAEIISTPRISLSTSSLSFAAEQNGIVPASKSFTITNVGINTLNWSVSDNVSWLDVSPASGNSNSSVITATVNSTNLTPGVYNSVISINSTNADNSPRVINVTYNVTSSTPHISTSLSSMNFNAIGDGALPTTKQFTVSNTSGGLMNWTVSSTANWLDVSPTSGNNNSAIITASVNTTAKSIGSYSATILVSSSNADNSPIAINVNYNIAMTSTNVIPVGSWTTGLTHNLGAGTERLLLFSVAWEDLSAGSDRPISNITYGNIAMTQVIRQMQPSYQCVEIWYLKESDILLTSNNNFNITWTNGQPGVTIHYAAGAYSGVDQTNPISDFSTATSATGVPNPLTTSLNSINGGYSIAVASHGRGSSSFLWNNGWVTQVSQSDVSATSGCADHAETVDGITTVSVTKLDNSASRFVLAAVALQPSFGQSTIDTIAPAAILDLQQY